MNADDMNKSLAVLLAMLVQASRQLPDRTFLHRHIEEQILDLLAVQADQARRTPINDHA
jgi:hypothetical protein